MFFAWTSLSDRFCSRLSGWKDKYLTIRERLTLVKSVLGSLGSDLMSNFLASISIVYSLEVLRESFFGYRFG